MRNLLTTILQSRRTATSGKTLVTVCTQSVRFGSCKTGCTEEGKRTVRGRLPWEIDYYKECLETKPSKFPCKDCKPEKLVKMLTMTECERRKLERCMRVHKNKMMCTDLGISSIDSKKTYPMRLIEEKKYLPGNPMSGWDELYKKTCAEDCK